MPILSSSKWELFAQGLAQGLSASEAYQRAGYKRHDGNAGRLSKNEEVKARVDEILSAAAKNTGITAERVLSELAKIAFADIRKAVKWGNGVVIRDGETGEEHVVNDVALIASDVIDDGTAAAISEVSKTKDGIKLKMHDKQRALELLGKNLGILKEKIEHTGEITLASLITKSWEKA
jgi:phage terminase small subunit